MTGQGFPKIYYLLRALNDLCVLILRNLMKTYLLPMAILVFALGACERHPASQLSTEGEAAKAEPEKSEASEGKQSTPGPSPSGTPKTYFPQNS